MVFPIFVFVKKIHLLCNCLLNFLIVIDIFAQKVNEIVFIKKN